MADNDYLSRSGVVKLWNSIKNHVLQKTTPTSTSLSNRMYMMGSSGANGSLMYNTNMTYEPNSATLVLSYINLNAANINTNTVIASCITSNNINASGSINSVNINASGSISSNNININNNINGTGNGTINYYSANFRYWVWANNGTITNLNTEQINCNYRANGNFPNWSVGSNLNYASNASIESKLVMCNMPGGYFEAWGVAQYIYTGTNYYVNLPVFFPNGVNSIYFTLISAHPNGVTPVGYYIAASSNTSGSRYTNIRFQTCSTGINGGNSALLIKGRVVYN